MTITKLVIHSSRQPRHCLHALLVLLAEGNTGYRAMGEFVAQLILDAAVSLDRSPSFTQEERARFDGALPKPMLPGNYETMHDSCYNNNAFRAIVTTHVSAGREQLTSACK